MVLVSVVLDSIATLDVFDVPAFNLCKSSRSALKLVLEQQGIDVAGDVSDSGELLAWFKTNQADLLLLDWELPDQPGKQIIPILRARYPRLAVIVLNSRPQTRTEALSAGADGFVSKGDPPEYLLSLLATAWRADKHK